MKPKPLESLNHFTVPVAISYFLAKSGEAPQKFVFHELKVGSAGYNELESKRLERVFTWVKLGSQEFFRGITSIFVDFMVEMCKYANIHANFTKKRLGCIICNC